MLAIVQAMTEMATKCSVPTPACHRPVQRPPALTTITSICRVLQWCGGRRSTALRSCSRATHIFIDHHVDTRHRSAFADVIAEPSCRVSTVTQAQWRVCESQRLVPQTTLLRTWRRPCAMYWTRSRCAGCSWEARAALARQLPRVRWLANWRRCATVCWWCLQTLHTT